MIAHVFLGWFAATALFTAGYVFRVAMESAASESAARGDR